MNISHKLRHEAVVRDTETRSEIMNEGKTNWELMLESILNDKLRVAGLPRVPHKATVALKGDNVGDIICESCGSSSWTVTGGSAMHTLLNEDRMNGVVGHRSEVKAFGYDKETGDTWVKIGSKGRTGGPKLVFRRKGRFGAPVEAVTTADRPVAPRRNVAPGTGGRDEGTGRRRGTALWT